MQRRTLFDQSGLGRDVEQRLRQHHAGLAVQHRMMDLDVVAHQP
jgi:hypothetical protein